MAHPRDLSAMVVQVLLVVSRQYRQEQGIVLPSLPVALKEHGSPVETEMLARAGNIQHLHALPPEVAVTIREAVLLLLILEVLRRLAVVPSVLLLAVLEEVAPVGAPIVVAAVAEAVPEEVVDNILG